MLNQCCKPEHEPLFEPLLGSKVRALLCELLQPVLETLDRNRLRLPPELGTVMTAGAIYGAVLAWAMGGVDKKLSLSAEQFTELILPVIGASLFKLEQEESPAS